MQSHASELFIIGRGFDDLLTSVLIKALRAACRTASLSMQEKESIANSGGRETGKRVVSSTYVGKIR